MAKELIFSQTVTNFKELTVKANPMDKVLINGKMGQLTQVILKTALKMATESGKKIKDLTAITTQVHFLEI